MYEHHWVQGVNYYGLAEMSVYYYYMKSITYANVFNLDKEDRYIFEGTDSYVISLYVAELPTLIWCAPVCSVSDCDAPRNIKPYIQSMVATPLGISQEIFRYPLQVNVFSRDVHVPFIIDFV